MIPLVIEDLKISNNNDQTLKYHVHSTSLLSLNPQFTGNPKSHVYNPEVWSRYLTTVQVDSVCPCDSLVCIGHGYTLPVAGYNAKLCTQRLF